MSLLPQISETLYIRNTLNVSPLAKLDFKLANLDVRGGGNGGLHSQHAEPRHVASTPDSMVLEIDFSSFYPTLMANVLDRFKGQILNIEHKEFAILIRCLIQTRLKLKDAGDPLHNIYKLILNSPVGKT